MRANFYLVLSFVLLLANPSFSQDRVDTLSVLETEEKHPILDQVIIDQYTLKATASKKGSLLTFIKKGANGEGHIFINGEDMKLDFVDGAANFEIDPGFAGRLYLINNKIGKKNNYNLTHISKMKRGSGFRIRHIPLWMSIIPPLIAIILALVFKEVIVSLFLGIWAGAFIASGLRFDSLYYMIDSFFSVLTTYILGAISNSSHVSIILFSLLIGGMVAIISRNGGMAGVVKSLSRYAKSARSTQFITWFLGIAIFFDDYANTLIVGNTMRSVTDKFKISREKLAYIVDSTAAPVSAVAFITTWIGAELSYIAGATAGLEGFDTSLTPYAIFMSSLKYSYYPIFTLGFILMLIYTKRDFGKMYKAEMRARTTGQVSSVSKTNEDEPNMEDLSPVEGAPLKWRNAVIPVMVVIFMTIFGLVDTGIDSIYQALADKGIAPDSAGWGAVWSQIGGVINTDEPSFIMKMGKLIGSSDSYKALLWASFSGVVVAIMLTISGKIMNLFETMHTMTTGFKTMLPALIILSLAWSLAITTEQLHTADYITLILADSVSPYLMPGIIFILSALIAFSTGSSWSTMAILYPIAIPTTWAMCQNQGIDPNTTMELLLNVIAVVLGASVVGDHCSPISDTTILSSLASDCNHIDHVKTQLPYALTVAAVSLTAAIVVAYLGGGWLMSLFILVIGFLILWGIIMKFGKKVDA